MQPDDNSPPSHAPGKPSEAEEKDLFDPSALDAEEEEVEGMENGDTALCISCLKPNHPHAHFCHACNTPLSSYANTAPWESTLAEGKAYRNAIEGTHKPIVYIGIILIGLPFAGAGIDWIFFYEFPQEILFGLLLLALGWLLVWNGIQGLRRRGKKV